MYVGRFAPTNSGPLHFGSLLAAVASYLDAKVHDGRWLLRIDDIDKPRVTRNAEKSARTTLANHGMAWDGEVSHQRDNEDHYRMALEKLQETELLFYCDCTRSLLRRSSSYSGRCRANRKPLAHSHAVRIRTPATPIGFNDLIQGSFTNSLADIGGDFVIWRKERIPSYPLSVVVDDELSGITNIVRGADLVENTLCQLFLIDLLGFKQPVYAHVPVLNERNDVKLSKRNDDTAVDNSFPRQNLEAIFQLLGMEPPRFSTVRGLLAWGIDHWSLENVPPDRCFEHYAAI